MRIYTLEEARAALTQIVPLLERIRAASHALRELQGIVARASGKSATNGHMPVGELSGEDRHDALATELSEAMAELNTFEIELKDPDRGLIDFYYERGGQIVYLCFMLGEVDISSWHHIDAGFAGRQPL